MFCRRAVLIFEEDTAVLPEVKPLMLEAIRSRPILSWMCGQLQADGIQRFFAVCGPRFADEVRKILPPEAEVSEQWRDLEAFLDTEEPVLVFPRAAFPLAEAGAGFVYAAPGRDLRDLWRVRMTNAVQGAELVSGWLPVYGPDTLEELETLMHSREPQD